MLVVVESGSTKADWMVITSGEEKAYSTKGFNPYFHSKQDILIELNDHLELDLIKGEVKELYFYGAGCSSSELNKIIENGLKAFFINAKITVSHDLSACAYACYKGVAEIACIIGTGSNSCFYDGNEVYEELPALGHILGDEGSGSYFGKRLLADFLYGKLPAPLHQELIGKGLNSARIIENVYRKSNANVYIASFMPALVRHKELEYSQSLIKKGFKKFIDTHVKCYSNYKQCEVNFVGSLADLLQEELIAVCEESNITVGRIIRRPLDKLVSYHKNKQGMAQKSLSTKDVNQLN